MCVSSCDVYAGRTPIPGISGCVSPTLRLDKMCVTNLASEQLEHAVFGIRVARNGEVLHGCSALSCMLQKDGQERHDERRQDEVEVHLLRREHDPQDRQRRQAALRLSRLASHPLASVGHARRRQDVPQEDGAVLGDMADAAQDRGGAQGRLRRRHTSRQESRRAHRLRRGARPRLAPVPLREQPRLGGADVARRRPGGCRLRRRGRLRQGPEGDVAEGEAPEVRLPRLLTGEALYHDKAKDAGGRRALRAGQGCSR